MERIFPILAGCLAVFFATTAFGIDKSSSLSVSSDSSTGITTVECDISVKGIARKATYNGHMRFVPITGTTDVIRPVFVISHMDRIFSESSPGLYEFQAKLSGDSVVMHGEFFFPNPTDVGGIKCGGAIYNGPSPSPYILDAIYGIEIGHDYHSP